MRRLERRLERLEAFEETFAKLEGVTEEHVDTLRKAATTTAFEQVLREVGAQSGATAENSTSTSFGE